ncbi:type I restriction enzyme HsdR N-terminal domain-containing protein [Diaphorobacter aerolatus]|uniref:Type I restriction enzyme HsdR N-terminal domain-containing protein n=1 Tax=Diaphorobacter aerolatus TaxID=1288495 RepID=A0A7H0GK10_9BURK|nr:type I restriction enzyme HsdR N-terminal domain-containing protein [Diaphorobacter aerolatus]QNP48626.1 type I restriction enzyme HsdR N-terminal domain-containing protein [Diaphorobacter aerolatus]
MTITTTQPPEAELEARIDATLERVFAGVTQLRHQSRFKLRVGRTVLEAGVADYVEGRADIIVYKGDVAVAVLELKREGLALTADDEAQGRSYALLAQAPIVVITNGADTRIYQTHDMELLSGATVDEVELARRIEAAATAAQSGVTSAVSKLLGTDLGQSAVAAITSGELEELTGDWNSGERFVDRFLVPRQATKDLRTALRSGSYKVLLLAGPPLCGKSSVLRELALQSHDEPWDILFVEGAPAAKDCSGGLQMCSPCNLVGQPPRTNPGSGCASSPAKASAPSSCASTPCQRPTRPWPANWTRC